jgi:co-chaperonin GroES (HSP10)
MPKLRLLGDYVLVRMDPDTDKVAGGVLYKPDAAFETLLRTGEVLALGPGKEAKRNGMPTGKRLPIDLKIGDGVVFNRFIASNTKTAEAMHRQHVLDENEALIRPNDVLLVFDREEAPRFE